MTFIKSSKNQKVTRVILSIKPHFANKIFTGEKKFEYRKVIFKNHNINTVIVYASFPIMKVIGEFKIKRIINDSPDKIWRLTKKDSGIDKSFFDYYFENKTEAYAIEISEFKLYDEPKDLIENYKVKPPQSFSYIY